MELFQVGDLSLLLLVYLIIYLSQYGLMDIFIIPWFKIPYNLIFLLKLFQLWPLTALSVGCCSILTYSHHVGIFFGIREGVILFSNTTWCSRFILFIPWPCPRISHFYKDTWVILLENGIINEDLGAKYANSYGNVCVSFLLGPLRWKSKEIYVCILIPT